MIKFFNPEDFKSWFCGKNEDYHSVAAAETANRILTERGVQAYGSLDAGNWFGPNKSENDTDTALLIAIEPIQRDTPESLLREVCDKYCDIQTSTVSLREWLERARKVLKY